MKKWIITVAALAAAGVLIFWLFQARPKVADGPDEVSSPIAQAAHSDATPAPPAVGSGQVRPPASPDSPTVPQSPPIVAAPASARTSSPIPALNAEAPNALPPATLLENMRTTV